MGWDWVKRTFYKWFWVAHLIKNVVTVSAKIRDFDGFGMGQVYFYKQLQVAH